MNEAHQDANNAPWLLQTRALENALDSHSWQGTHYHYDRAATAPVSLWNA